MSTTNPNRSQDAAGLRRMQDLDKALFGTGPSRNRSVTAGAAVDDNSLTHPLSYSVGKAAPWASTGHNGTGQLPPLIAAWPEHGTAATSVSQSFSGPGLVPGPAYSGASPRVYGTGQRPRSQGAPVQRRAANAKPPRRGAPGASLDPISGSTLASGTGSLAAYGPGSNPWEAFLEAAPATRYSGAPSRDGDALHLLMPSGSSREAMLTYEQRLASHLQPVSGPSGTAAVVSTGGGGASGGRAVGGSSTSPGRLPPSPSRHLAGSLPSCAPAASGGGYAPPNRHSFTGEGPMQQQQQPSPGPSLPPLVPRSAMSAALAAPAPGAEPPWGGAGLPYGTHNSLAEVRGGMVAGMAATTLRDGVEYGSGGVGGDPWDTVDPHSPPLLGQLMSGRPTSRRQVQLMADWLDTTIGSLWEQHLAAAAAAGTGAAAGGAVPVDGLVVVGACAAPYPADASPSAAAGQPTRRTAGGGGGSGGAAAGGGKAALAMRFGNISAGLRDLSANLYGVATQPQLWAGMVEATAAVSHAVVSNVAHRCWEEGALLARLWNLHTALLDSGLATARRAQEQLSATAAEQAAKIRRLDPLIDWELESRATKESLAGELEAARAEALLAGRERDALLRENDKIIAHYRRELKTYRSEQRRNAYQLARKLRNTQQQLELMTRDRDLLYSAVSYTKSQTAQLVDLIGGMHGHLRTMANINNSAGHAASAASDAAASQQKAQKPQPPQAGGAGRPGGAGGSGGGGVTFALLGEESFPELYQIEQGLKNILHSVTKVRDVNQDAEDSHFVVEEQVTAVAAADTVGDELVDEVLAEGDPEPEGEGEAAEGEGAEAVQRQTADSGSEYDSDEPDPNSALSMLAEAALRGTGESSEEEVEEYEEDEEGGEGKTGGSGRRRSRRIGGGGGSFVDGDEGFAVLVEEDLLDETAVAEASEGAAAGGEGEEGAEDGESPRRKAARSPSRASRSPHSRRSTPIPTTAGEADSPTSVSGGADGSGRRTPASTGGSRSVTPSGSPPLLRPSGTASPAPQGGANGKKKKNKGKGRGGGGGGSMQREGGGAESTSGGAGGAGRAGGSGAGRTTPGGSYIEGRTTPGGTAVTSAEGGSRGGTASPRGPGQGHGGGGSAGQDRPAGHEGDSRGGQGFSFPSATPPMSPALGPNGTPLSSSPPSTSGGVPVRRTFDIATAGTQTTNDLMRGIADPEVAERARQMAVLREALSEIGIMGNPNDDADGTDGLLTALRQYMASLSQEAGALTKQLEKFKATAEAAEAARTDLSQTAEARGREVAAVRRELLEAKKKHSQLCDALEAIGIDPRSPSLPPSGDGVESPRVHLPEGVARGKGGGKGGKVDGESPGGGGRGKGGSKVSRLAAVKEKARERALAATSQAPVLGRASAAGTTRASTAASGGGAAAGNGSGSRVQLPAAMLAAAAQRAAEAAAAGEADAAVVGGGAAGYSAWRAAAGGGGGGNGGPVPVYIRPDRAAATARLQDALMRYADAKPRTLEWLLKLIDSMYRGKAVSDEQRYKIGQEPLTMIEYMFQHLSGQYGTKDLVNQYAAQLVATCLQYCAGDPRVSTFQRFLMEDWDTRVLSAYMDATRKLLEPSRVPCCDFPPDYVPAGGRKGDSAPLDLRKALWVAEKVLMRRSPKAAYVFAQLLNSRSEPVSASELDTYFVSPGSYGTELQQVRQYELGRAEFKRVSSSVFLDALCGEYARMENIFREQLPELFARYDADSDGWITRQDIVDLVHDMANDMSHAGIGLPEGALTGAPGGGGGGSTAATSTAGGGGGISEADREAATEVLWNLLTGTEADARSRADASLVYPDGAVRGPGGGPVSAAAVTHLSDGGFVEGAFKSDFARAWVRAFRTGAAHLPGGVGALAEMDLHAARDAARRLLSVVVARYWGQHGEVLEGFFTETGPLAEQQLKQQVALLEGDMGGTHGDGRDGPKRAAALVTVLRLLVVKKADRLSALLTAEGLTGGPHNGPSADLEELLSRLTAAVRLLYGPPDSIWVVGAEVDELTALGHLEPGDVEALPAGYKRWVANVAVRCCALHDRLHLALPPSPLIPNLQTHRGVPYYARMWRRVTAAAVAARRRASVAAAAGRSPTFGARQHQSMGASSPINTGMGFGAASSSFATRDGSGGGAATESGGVGGGGGIGGGGGGVGGRSFGPSSPVKLGSTSMKHRPGSPAVAHGRPTSPNRSVSGARTMARSPSARPASGARARNAAPMQQGPATMSGGIGQGAAAAAAVSAPSLSPATSGQTAVVTPTSSGQTTVLTPTTSGQAPSP